MTALCLSHESLLIHFSLLELQGQARNHPIIQKSATFHFGQAGLLLVEHERQSGLYPFSSYKIVSAFAHPREPLYIRPENLRPFMQAALQNDPNALFSPLLPGNACKLLQTGSGTFTEDGVSFQYLRHPLPQIDATGEVSLPTARGQAPQAFVAACGPFFAKVYKQCLTPKAPGC